MGNPKVRTSYEKVLLARDPKRPTIVDYLDHLFTDFLELKGDRLGGEDASILGGIAYFHQKPVTVIGHRKGRNLEENIAYNFGMPGPSGYRKAKRLMEQAEKFRRPIITFIDTPGAYPGIEAEENGQSVAIAECLAAMSKLTVPVIAIVTGEGSSGGALALAVANQVWMLENAVYSILSPEGFASIIWKDGKRSQEACEIMKITSQDLLAYGLIEGILPEAPNGIQQGFAPTMRAIDRMLVTQLNGMSKIKGSVLREQRYRRFRNIEGQYCPE
jgi:acetyl-CoA carboxylase carboxyl transferase alpha subunit